MSQFIHYGRTPCIDELSTLRKLYFRFLSNWMGYDHGVSIPFDFEPNGNPFGSNSREKLSHIPFNVSGNGNIVFSVCRKKSILD